jgi:hypothetical protein
MDDEDDAPSAEYVGVDVAPDADSVAIETTGEALLVDGYDQARVCVRIGGPESEISLTLSPADARGLRDDLSAAIDEARAEVEKWAERDDFRRR